jgi:uncharacterized protein YkwD
MRPSAISSFRKHWLARSLAAVVLFSLLSFGVSRLSAHAATDPHDCSVSAAAVAFDSEETKMLDLVNAYRLQNGVPALQISYTLSKSAQWKSQDMAVGNYMDHADLFNNNRSFDQRDRDCGYGYNVWHGENIEKQGVSANTMPNSTEGVFYAWQNSSGHNSAMLDPDFQVIGIGRAFSTNSGTFPWAWTTDFGGYADGSTYVPPLANDDFAGAAQITSLPFSDGPYSTLNTATVTREVNEPRPCCQPNQFSGMPEACNLSGMTVWYEFTPAVAEVIEADTLASNYNTVIGVYTGPTIGALTPLICNDNYGSVQSLAQVTLDAGVTYHFQVGNLFTSQSDPNTVQPYPTDLVFHVTCLSGSCPGLSPTPSPALGSPTATSTPSPTATSAPSPTATPAPSPSATPEYVIDPITQPTDGATVPAGKTIKVAATASAALGIAKVEFYVNGVRKCSDSSAPYSCNWGVPSQRGVNYTLEDRAYDNAGHTASGKITVTSGVDSTPPIVSVAYPLAGASVTANTTTTISASASDEVGVAKVEFYVNGSRKCSDSVAPYSCAWKVPRTPGVTYTIQARAYDFAGNTSTQAVTVTSH